MKKRTVGCTAAITIAIGLTGLAQRPLSIEGRIDPRWRGDGKELFYYSSTGQLMAVPVNASQTLDVGKAVPLFIPGLVNGPQSPIGDMFRTRAQYDVSRDGQRFLLNVPVEAQDAERLPPSITVVLNWMSGMSSR